MKNFIRGTLLGSALGITLFWYGGASDYFPAIVAIVILIGVLIPLESQERHMLQLIETVQEVRDRLDRLDHLGDGAPFVSDGKISSMEGPYTFIPTIRSEMSSSRPAVPQEKRTVDRSLEDVAKKLSSMQGG